MKIQAICEDCKVKEGFVDELGKAKSNKERRELLEDGIMENAFSETIDFELSFSCKGVAMGLP